MLYPGGLVQRGLDGPLRPHAIWAQFGVFQADGGVEARSEPFHHLCGLSSVDHAISICDSLAPVWLPLPT